MAKAKAPSDEETAEEAQEEKAEVVCAYLALTLACVFVCSRTRLRIEQSRLALKHQQSCLSVGLWAYVNYGYRLQGSCQLQYGCGKLLHFVLHDVRVTFQYLAASKAKLASQIFTTSMPSIREQALL